MKTLTHTGFENDYIECLFWSTNDNSNEQGGEPLENNYTADDLSSEASQQIHNDCKKFRELAGDLIENDPHPGHDFWLTRNGHSAGFWDGDYFPKERAEKLTDIAKSFGQIDPYIGDDGLIYLA